MPALIIAVLAMLLPVHLTEVQISLVPIAHAQTLPATLPIPPSIADMITTAAKARGVSADLAIAIAQCESQLRQYDNTGALLLGPDGHDIGVFQIRETQHATSSEQLGMNTHTIAGNINYGILLLKQDGTAPWNSSRACWSKLIPKT